jgi:hypothetical protein
VSNEVSSTSRLTVGPGWDIPSHENLIPSRSHPVGTNPIPAPSHHTINLPVGLPVGLPTNLATNLPTNLPTNVPVGLSIYLPCFISRSKFSFASSDYICFVISFFVEPCFDFDILIFQRDVVVVRAVIAITV